MPSFKKMGKTGRVEKLTDEVIEKIVNAMRAGAYVETAAIVSGVSKEALYKYLRQGRDPQGRVKEKTVYGRLIHAVEKAFEECTMRDLLVIDKCANGIPNTYLKDKDGNFVVDNNGKPYVEQKGNYADWQASAWRLERRGRKHWSKTEKLEITGKDGDPIATTQETEEERQKRKERIKLREQQLKALHEYSE